MPNLAEILSSPATLEQAAIEFADLCEANMNAAHQNMNSGITSDDEFCALLDKCGNQGINYKRLCEIGVDD